MKIFWKQTNYLLFFVLVYRVLNKLSWSSQIEISFMQRVCNFHLNAILKQAWLWKVHPRAIIRSDFNGSISRDSCSFSVGILLIAVAICVHSFVYVCMGVWSEPRCGSVAYHCQLIHIRYPCRISKMTFCPTSSAHFILRSISRSVAWAKQFCQTQFWWHFRNGGVYTRKVQYRILVLPYAMQRSN